MHIAYSVLSEDQNFTPNGRQGVNESGAEIKLRYDAYRQACNKLSAEIAAIQKYYPGWMPRFQRS